MDKNDCMSKDDYWAAKDYEKYKESNPEYYESRVRERKFIHSALTTLLELHPEGITYDKARSYLQELEEMLTRGIDLEIKPIL